MGTILRREAKQVVSDLMEKHGIPKAVWSIKPDGELHFLIGHRCVKLKAGAGMSYYALQGLEAQVEASIRDYHTRPDKRQVDLEELLEAEGA
jgi:hypothetical protein